MDDLVQGGTDRDHLASWTRWLFALIVATTLAYGIDVVFGVLPAGASELFQKFASCSIFFGAAAVCLVKGRASAGEGSAWRLFGLAMALWGAGQAYFAIALWDSQDVQVPSIADGFWLAFYVPAYAALYKLLRLRSGAPRRGAWLDALVGGLGVGGAGAALVLQVVLKETHGTMTGTATNLAYPLADLGLVALVVGLITIVGWKASGAWRWIAAAFVLYTVADGFYLVNVANGSYGAGDFIDLGWPMAALLVAFAATRPEQPVQSGARAGTIVVPGLFAFAALAILVVDHFVRLNPLALGLATASIFVMLVRLYLTVQDNRRMLADSRHEAATDALTGLGNRRRLATDLASHVGRLDPERPLMLTLFDLDGFKQYNDTFGHPSGDQLLERLGGRLSALLAGRGTAYRMGGDEFCALWHLADPGEASVSVMAAVSALSEQGEAFSIGCSYGSVLLPNETTEPTDALRVADRRMYIRKGSGRTSAGRQSSDVLLRALAECDADLGMQLDGVAEMAPAIAMGLGVPKGETEAARQTALLHDVGKVAIPDEILRKPGPLEASEWEFMKRHTVIGERIISAAPALAAVARFVRSTHEHFDGSGYPDGLVGNDIPLIARVVAVCDAYDAMVTNRPYQEACDRPTAIAELQRCAGTQFDPAVVKAFVNLLDATDEPVALVRRRV